jgi:hypothetical protein
MNRKYPTFFLTWFNKFPRVPSPGNVGTVLGIAQGDNFGVTPLYFECSLSTMSQYMQWTSRVKVTLLKSYPYHVYGRFIPS